MDNCNSIPGNSNANGEQLVINHNIEEDVQEQKNDIKDSNNESITNPLEMVDLALTEKDGNFENENNKTGSGKTELQSSKKVKLQQDVEMRTEEVNEVEAVFDNSLNPLMMEDILSGIMIRLDMNSLKISRQICKLWEEVATKRMFKRGIYFVVSEKLIKITNLRTQRYERRQVKDFISTKRDKIENIFMKTEKDVEILQTLGIFGKNVKHLKFDFCNAPKYFKLMKGLSNLKELTADGRFSSSIVTTLDTFLSLKKPIVISELFFSTDQLDCFERFCKGQVTVNKITIATFWPSTAFQSKTIDILNGILWNNRESLAQIWFVGLIGSISSFKLEIPQMPNVHRICIRLDQLTEEVYRQGFLFPPQFKFDICFPNLRVFSVDFSSSTDMAPVHTDFMRQVFENSGPASKVEYVVCFVLPGRQFNTEFYQTTFPNAKIKVTEH